MYSAQSVQVKGDISLESVQVYAGGMGGSMGFPQMGGAMGFPQMGGAMNFPQMGMNMPYVQPPQPSFGGGFNVGFGQPSAPSIHVAQSFPVCTFLFIHRNFYLDYWI